MGDGEIGEIAIRGENVMKGYWRRPEATAEAIPDGWFRTGDLATVDEDGYYTIVDRKKDLIIRGGYNVYPREVEEVLFTHPAVAEAAVVGKPDERLGEEVLAYVALKPGASATPEEIARRILQETVVLPPRLHPGVPPDLEAVVASGLAKIPEQRCGSAAALAAELSGIAAIMAVRSEVRQAASAAPAVSYERIADQS